MRSTHNVTAMTGKVCLITGATSGIGKFAAAGLAAQGADLVIAGRNAEKASQTVEWIRSTTGNHNVDCLLADFSDLSQVRQMAGEFNQRYPHLDVLVNNAGSFYNTHRETPYGVELTFLVNHLAPFLLTSLLLDTLGHSAPARVINLSSDAHKYGSLDFDDLDFRKEGYVGIKAYARSKLANILFAYELARRLANNGVTVNALHPGHVATDIWRNDFSFIGPALKWITGLFSLSPEQGAESTIYLATSPEVEGITGKYFNKLKLAASSPASYDEAPARRLWEFSEEITSEKSIKNNLQGQ